MTTPPGGSARDDPASEVPNVARIYDYMLGGAHNFAADREHAAQVVAAFPDSVATAWANRSFLRHAVDYALSLGVDQFLDLGSGIPTVGNVHEIAHRQRPEARVAYVDNESVAVAYSRELLAHIDNATITQADVRDPEAVLTAPGVAGLLDFSRPVAVLAVALFHFVADIAEVVDIVSAYRRPLAAGSFLALTHTSGDYPDHPEVVRSREAIRELYANASNALHDRTRAELSSIIEAAGFTVNTDGFVDVSQWAPPQHGGEPLAVYAVITEPLR